MATVPTHPLIRHLRRLARPRPAADATDAALLRRYAGRGDEAAFAVLVRRHGPMVHGVCRRVLGDWHAAEDAFQATFVLLARKAGSLGRPEALGPWLHGVAVRVSLKARARAARRRARERPLTAAPAVEPPDDLVWRDLRPLLDEAVGRLPAKYQTPLVLHYLEGRTVPEIARQLGRPAGTVAAQLARGRERLRARLARRSLGLSAAALAAALAEGGASAGVPAPLLTQTLTAATAVAAGTAAAGVIPAEVAALTKGVFGPMSLTKVKVLAVLLLAAGTVAVGVGVRPGPSLAGPGKVEGQPGPKPAAPPEPGRQVRPDRPAREDAVERLLRSPVNMDFQDVPLRQVLQDLRAAHGLNIVPDRPALEEAGLSLDRRVSVRVSGVSLKSALSLILHDAGLAYTVREGIVVVTTPAAARGKLVRRLYPVGRLVGRGPEAKADALIRVITRTVSPESWADVGGPGCIEYFPEGRSLVVVQTPDVQEEVASLLEDLRKLKEESEQQ
jgi:RNA polymerase sigma factor (sigma-70 family)